jgi:PKD repeat protein
VRHSGVVTLYINGTASGNTYNGTVTDNSSSVLAVGNLKGSINASFPFNGYIDEFRFSSGIARWTGNFSPPSSQYAVGSAPPSAAFSASPANSQALLPIQFTDASTGSVANWNWNFGDGSGSTSQYPMHAYSTPGTYSVSLTASGPGGSNSATQANYITITAPSAGIDRFTELMLHGDGSDGGTVILDCSAQGWTASNPSNGVTTRVAEKEFGMSSLLFTNSTASCLTFPASADWSLALGDWTIDCWVYLLGINTYGDGICGTLSSANIGWGLGILGSNYSDNGQVSFFTDNNWVVASTAEVPLKTWTHIALVRYNGVVTVYINGIASGGAYNGLVTDNPTSVLAVGNFKGAINSSFPFNGYIDEFRFSKGIARWTSNFTPPTSEYQAQ